MPRPAEYYFRWNDSNAVKKLIIQQVMVVRDMEGWQQTRRDLGNDSNDEFINQKLAPLQKKREALQKKIDKGRDQQSAMKPKPVKISSPKKPLVAFKPAPAKKVVAKKVMKPPAKKVVAKVMKPAMKKPMKKPIAYGNVLTALTGKRPRKAPAKPTQVARFFVGGNVLPKGQKVAMPKKTTTMKARKPMSAETKLKIKQGVQKYHKNCKKAMSMYSQMKK